MLYLRVATPPVIPGSAPMLRYIDILRVVQFGIRRVLNALYYLSTIPTRKRIVMPIEGTNPWF